MATLDDLLNLSGVAAADADGITRGVFVETTMADFNQLFGALVGER